MKRKAERSAREHATGTRPVTIAMVILLGGIFFGPLFVASDVSAGSDAIIYGSINKNSWVVSGRNFDHTSDVKGDFLYHVPVGQRFDSKGSDGSAGKGWYAQYAFIGVDALGTGAKKLVDGLNDQGLSAAALWMHTASFPTEATGEDAMELGDLVAWILGTQKSVKDLAHDIAKLKVWYLRSQDTVPYPVHIVVHDVTGQSLVFEWVKGKLNVWNDKVYNGVLTNDPDYEVHLQNMTLYARFSNKDTYPDPDVPDDWLLGGGMLGMGGDHSSVSRFIRLSLLREYASQIVTEWTCFEKPAYGAAWSVQQAFHLMNRVTGIHGEMRHSDGTKDLYTRTALTIVRDHTNKKIYYRGYKSLTISHAALPTAGTVLPKGISAIENMDDLLGDASVVSTSALPAAILTRDESNLLSMSVSIPVASEKQSTAGKMYIFARNTEGDVSSWNGQRWVTRGSALVPCWRGRLETKVFDVIRNSDMEQWRGARFYAGYGTGDAEMFLRGTYGLIHHENGEIEQDAEDVD